MLNNTGRQVCTVTIRCVPAGRYILRSLHVPFFMDDQAWAKNNLLHRDKIRRGHPPLFAGGNYGIPAVFCREKNPKSQ